MTACATPGCDKPARSLGLCGTHYRAAYRNGERTERAVRPLTGTLPIRPHRTKAQRDALHRLAESNPTPTEYERKKALILRGEHHP